MKGYGVHNLQSSNGNNYLLYYWGHRIKSINGVGIIVANNRNINFEPISDRICVITKKINNTHKLIIVSVYAPTLETSEKNHDVRDNFYNELGSIISRVKSRDSQIVAGDFNAKTGSAALKSDIYQEVIGKFDKIK